jgi:hypothetical protein
MLVNLLVKMQLMMVQVVTVVKILVKRQMAMLV